MSGDDYEFWIPRNLDAPPLFFIWEADIAAVYIVWIFIGLTAQMAILGFVMALIMGRSYAKLKEEGGRGLLVKFLYWFTPSDLWLTKRHASNIREYIGG